MTPAEQAVFDRDLINHWSHFGQDALLRKVKSGWIVDFQGKGFPVVYKTKREAGDMATKWVLARSHARAGIA